MYHLSACQQREHTEHLSIREEYGRKNDHINQTSK